MQEINWGNYNAKFNGKEQSTFQWLCYLLFCQEFKLPLGIARYANHAGIETDPIKVGDDYIGWQSKYYTTPLNKHKQDFIDSIDTAKKNHTDLTKIIFYTNQDFGQGQGSSPPYKTAIETHAKSKGVVIEWRTASYFESPFVTQENASITKHFFDLGKSVFDLINELRQHSENILGLIQADIKFGENDIKLDRSTVTVELIKKMGDKTPVILSGDGGTGKTAIIKDLYELSKSTTPIFIFKATEFNNISNVNELVKQYGDFSLADFITAYEDTEEKCIVVDSAEKLSDLNDPTVFQEFVKLLLDNKWKIIFTTRRSYLDDLKYLLISLYRIAFSSIDISDVDLSIIEELSKKYSFDLPADSRMQSLICNPFYLNEYLQNYTGITADTTFADFKKVLWDKQIAKTTSRKDNIHIRRSECFIELAKKRANQGSFFIKSDGLDPSALQKLVEDEIVGYDDRALGYFIAHDIYEEWALEKVIEASFLKSSEPDDFYKDIGDSLPIRRAFRTWLSSKIVSDKQAVKTLISKTIGNNNVASHWQDEAIISILLSDNPESFSELLEANLLQDDAALLVKTTFLLRIACKQVDEHTLKMLGVKATSLKSLFTKPKGSGWNSIIVYINNHKEDLGLSHLNSILPLIKDWNSKNKRGSTTQNASQIALFYYEKIADDGGFGYGSRDLEKNIIETILSGATEIKDELSTIADDVISNKLTHHRDKYHELIEAMLSSSYSTVEVAQAIPLKMLQLANIFWSKDEGEEDDGYSPRIGVEGSFGITENRQAYFPASSYQTPIYMLLRFAPKETIDFILTFTNKSVITYSKSELSENEIHEVEVFIQDGLPIKQYMSNRLWEMYRGTHVSTGVLESMHMALEKWLLEYAKTASKEELEAMCIYLLKNSKSASISAVVTSVVLANPEKLFNVAVILFKTKEFFLYDTGRLLKDRSRKSDLLMLRNSYPSNDYENEFHENERIEACDDSHRTHSLENQALFYQWFQVDNIDKDEVKRRQDTIWAIWDNYYSQLPAKSKESNSDKTWRLYLSRMDSRKMKLTTEKKDGQTLIGFSPKIDPKLKAFSNAALKESQDAMKYSSLMIWATMKWRGDEKVTDYPQYEDNPSAILDEVKEIFNDLKGSKEGVVDFIDRATPAYSCASLIRDYKDTMDEEQKKYCKEVLLQYALLPMQENYDYQYGDGLEAVINVLPLLLGIDSDDDPTIKTILFLTLFNLTTTGSGQHMYDHAALAILHRLWKIDPDLADSMFVGYLKLAPHHDDLREEVRTQNIAKKIYTTTNKQITDALVERYEDTIENAIEGKLKHSDLKDIENYDIRILEVAFEMLPYHTDNLDHKLFLDTVLPVFSTKIMSDDDDMDFSTRYRFFDKYANFVLTSTTTDIKRYLKPFIDGFDNSRNMGDFFKQFISVQDRLNRYDEFWAVWETFYDAMVKLSKDPRNRRDAKSIINAYLFAANSWKDEAKEWHCFKDREKKFFEKVSNDMGHHTATLHAVAKLIDGIGSNFIDDGITWISDMIKNNSNLQTEDLEVNTVYYLENIVRRFVLSNRQKIRSSVTLKNRLLIILDFLIQKGSVTAYLTREDIL